MQNLDMKKTNKREDKFPFSEEVILKAIRTNFCDIGGRGTAEACKSVWK